MTLRPRLDHVVSVRFTPEQMDQLRALVGDGSISGYLRDTVLARAYPPVTESRTYRCPHMAIAGRFNEPPRCQHGCDMVSPLASAVTGPGGTLTWLAA